MVRVPLLEQSELPSDYQHLLSEDAMGEINLLCAMANNPDILQSYMRYGTTLWQNSGLNGDDLERCILSIARTLDAAYEWNQHVPIARNLGVSDADIEAITIENFDYFDDRRAALLRYVQAVAKGDVDNETYAALAEHVDKATIVGATQLATHYLATARFLDALEIPLEGEFVGWTPNEN
ncbi:carboxymuconolactone decarboxylase family protein [Halalkalicoccus jeotgali]|nr:carboxymuconolactone decarboxylase family protein [Halalkalicoccus jeotgali]ADJ16872.1 Carboxymuconolactone decarboxylase [Halalkalicoccus jeotgali B3]